MQRGIWMIKARLNSGDDAVLSISVEDDHITVHIDSVLRALSLLPTVKYLIKEARGNESDAAEHAETGGEEQDEQRKTVAALLDMVADAGYDISLKKGPFKVSLR